MKQNTFIFWALVLSVGCGIPKSVGHINNGPDETQPNYELQSPHFRIPILGDYCFHTYNEKYSIDFDERFKRYVFSRLSHKKPQLLYCAHTTVPPYYSTLTVLYKNENDNLQVIDLLKQQVKDELKVKVTAADHISTNFGSAITMRYYAVNPSTKVTTCYQEYFINEGTDLFRVCFWTRDCDNTIIKEETEGLIKRIEL